MYSIKPGRGPSFKGALGSVVTIVFGMAWIILASSGAWPGWMAIPGALLVLAAAGDFLYSLFNVVAKNRMSEIDIVKYGAEPDPIAAALGHIEKADSPAVAAPAGTKRKIAGAFCPFCGEKVQQDFAFCPKCGKDI